MYYNAPLNHFQIEFGTVCVLLGGDKVHFHPQMSPNLDLMIKFGPRPSVKGRKPNNVERVHSWIILLLGNSFQRFFNTFTILSLTLLNLNLK